MNIRRVTAGALAVADSVFGLYLGYAVPTSGIPGSLLFWLSVILFLDSLLCLYGVHYAFLAAAVLAATIPADSALALSSMIETQFAFLALSILTLAANIVAFRTTSHLSEQANPMNLPVFG